MFNYEIVVRKTDVQFEAHRANSEDKTIHRKGMSHVDAPKAIREVYGKVCENQEEVDWLYEATRLFKATKITIS